MNIEFCNIFKDADFYDIFYYSCLLISALIGLYCIKKVGIGFKWLSILIVLTLISEIIARYISNCCTDPNNNIVYHIFTPIEYTLYVIIFRQFLNNKKQEKLLWLSALGLFLLEIFNSRYFQDIKEDCSNVIMVESVLLVFLSLVLFLKIRESPSQGNLLREGVFWFNSAVLCYYAFSTLHWGLHNLEVYKLKDSTLFPYHVHKILGGILYLTFSSAILLNAMSRPSTLKKT